MQTPISAQPVVNSRRQFKTEPASIENEFQEYFKVLLHKQINGTYLIPEWNTHFEWGNPVFTLAQIQSLLINHRNLAVIVPAIKVFSWATERQYCH